MEIPIVVRVQLGMIQRQSVRWISRNTPAGTKDPLRVRFLAVDGRWREFPLGCSTVSVCAHPVPRDDGFDRRFDRLRVPVSFFSLPRRIACVHCCNAVNGRCECTRSRRDGN